MPTATLTDVKNKTGDVFALADKHGAVTITSYNKPKYVICTFADYQAHAGQTLKPEPQIEAKPEPESKPKPVVKETQPEKPITNHPVEISTHTAHPHSTHKWERRSEREKDWVSQVKKLFIS